jgi:hypothetical protein
MLFIFLAGYATGRRMGKKEGIEEGLSKSFLHLQKEMLNNSECPLCRRTLKREI